MAPVRKSSRAVLGPVKAEHRRGRVYIVWRDSAGREHAIWARVRKVHVVRRVLPIVRALLNRRKAELTNAGELARVLARSR